MIIENILNHQIRHINFLELFKYTMLCKVKYNVTRKCQILIIFFTKLQAHDHNSNFVYCLKRSFSESV